jgi:hypothetical protein
MALYGTICGEVPSNAARLIAVLVVVAAIVLLVLVSGWADDNAPAGSQGRAPVTRPATNATP